MMTSFKRVSFIRKRLLNWLAAHVPPAHVPACVLDELNEKIAAEGRLA